MLELRDQIQKCWKKHISTCDTDEKLVLEISVQDRQLPQYTNELYSTNVRFDYLERFHSCLDHLVSTTPNSMNEQDMCDQCTYTTQKNNSSYITHTPGRTSPYEFTRDILASWCITSPLRKSFHIYIKLIKYCTPRENMKPCHKQQTTWLVEKWVFVYNTHFEYELVKYAKGTSKENACEQDVQFHVLLRVRSHDKIERALYKSVDFFQGFDKTTDIRSDIFRSCTYSTVC